jgi:hypothetical protein
MILNNSDRLVTENQVMLAFGSGRENQSKKLTNCKGYLQAIVFARAELCRTRATRARQPISLTL